MDILQMSIPPPHIGTMHIFVNGYWYPYAMADSGIYFENTHAANL